MSSGTEAEDGDAGGVAHPRKGVLADLDQRITCLKQRIEVTGFFLHRIIEDEDVVAHVQEVQCYRIAFAF
ncbi:hypothetical protein SDC9_91834 [bioreactor metagenome]|uniref:Uncharacterized protein n=1 Tax=bioreactor metagenome TaxID=1076179 RepID=A0A644ZXJ7_9ZZZZ